MLERVSNANVKIHKIIIAHWQSFWIFTPGQFWPLGIAIASICLWLCVSMCMSEPHACPHHLFKLGPPNSYQRCKTRLLLVGQLGTNLHANLIKMHKYTYQHKNQFQDVCKWRLLCLMCFFGQNMWPVWKAGSCQIGYACNYCILEWSIPGQNTAKPLI